MTTFPHCDAAVLHAPGDCRFCDLHSDWQELREAWGINFTGESDAAKIQCPSEQRRPLETINRWAGNVPQPEGEPLKTWFVPLDLGIDEDVAIRPGDRTVRGDHPRFIRALRAWAGNLRR